VLKEQIQTLTFEENVEFDTKDFKGRSDTCDIDYGKLEYRFKGNVLFRYDDVVIHALYVTYDKKTEEIRLTGDIRFVAGTNTVTSERAVIKRKEKIVEFYENTKASQGGSYIESQHMQYDLNKKEFIASTGRTRIIKNND
jgi:lipopolysaccharide assembly outer membrane protein LptD (OstA)